MFVSLLLASCVSSLRLGEHLSLGHDCPVEVPSESLSGGVDTPGYVQELLSILTYNGTNPGGKRTALIVFKAELQCYLAILLDQGCNGLQPSKVDRKEAWDSICLNPDAEYFDAFKMMTDQEKKVYNELTFSTTTSNYSTGLEVYNTMHNLTDPQDGESKEVMCGLMKIVDDNCVAFNTPRLSQQWEMLFTNEPPADVPDGPGRVFTSSQPVHGKALVNATNTTKDAFMQRRAFHWHS